MNSIRRPSKWTAKTMPVDAGYTEGHTASGVRGHVHPVAGWLDLHISKTARLGYQMVMAIT